MPEHMERRGAVYYIRRVIPKDLQPVIGRKEKWLSLRTKDFEEAKRRLRIEGVRFDDWFSAERSKLSKASRIAPANNESQFDAIVEARDAYERESADFFAELYGDDDESGLPFDQWIVESERRDRATDAAYFAEEKRNASVPLLDLFDRYASQPGKLYQTNKQWRAIIEHLIGYLGHDNALRVKRAHLVGWLDSLRVELGPRGKPRAIKTINDSYFSAVKAVFAYGFSRSILSENPTHGVLRLPREKRLVLRERDFTKGEQRMILAASLESPPSRMASHNASARRWVPWLCAYTGARVGEITQLRAMDLKQIDGVWAIHITPEAGTTKTNKARTVPLHDHLVEQGFVSFVQRKNGPLFYDGESPRKEGGRKPYKQAGNRLADWVRTELGLEEGVAPNHGWRHTFRTLAREADIPSECVDYIEGHAGKTQGSRYGAHTLATVFRELAKIPRFEVG